jgi:glycerol-3-phosphate acyltransferase PlsX
MQVKGPIAVDAMGGDGAPQTIVRGALESVTDSGISVCLVGPQKRLRRELGRFRFLPSGLELVDAPEVVGMNDPAISVLRGKKHSSLNVCAELVREGRATAMVTATLILDVGANMECKPHQLVQFAVMGSFYAEAVLGVGSPKVGLMSVGEEESKGGPQARERNRVLKAAGINFIGNVEGGDVFNADVDVIVCDGFTGNVILKVAEGFGEMVVGMLMDEARQSPMYGAGLLMAKGAFRNLRSRVDYSEYGGAPLLGVDGACLIGHGKSSAKAIRNAVHFAASYASCGVIERIGDKILEVLASSPVGRKG